MEPNPNDPNEQLLAAVHAKNLPLVEHLLQHPDLDLNYDIGDGNTVLFETRWGRDEDIILRLLDRGYSGVEHRNYEGQNLLHMAVVYSPVSFVHELIRRGVEINAYENSKHTPLSFAVMAGNLEAVCMLLYYGADANVKCCLSTTPLMWAIVNDELEVANVLLEYTDLSYRDHYDDTALYIATRQTSPLVLKILNNVDIDNERCEELFELALEYQTVEVFKLMWNLFGDRVVVKPSFFKAFFKRCGFSDKEWLEVWNSLLSSFLVKNIYEASFTNELNEDRFSHLMLQCLYQRDVQADIRLDIITLFVSLGVQITEDDLNIAHSFFSFQAELRFLIHTFNYEQEVILDRLDHKLRTLFTLDIDREIVRKHIATQTTHLCWNPLGYFAVPQNDRFSILEVVTGDNGTDLIWVERLEQIPEIPSLVEAARNEVMRSVKKIYNITKAYQYLELVENCVLPQVIKDILLLKVKLY